MDVAWMSGLCQRPARFSPYQLQRSISTASQNNFCVASNDEEDFKTILDVQQFKPDEIFVKVVDDFVVVEGNHEERRDAHGYVSRQFQRRYKLPEDVDADAVASSLSSDGVLTISMPKKQPVPLPDINERIVPIIQTNEPVVKKRDEKMKFFF